MSDRVLQKMGLKVKGLKMRCEQICTHFLIADKKRRSLCSPKININIQLKKLYNFFYLFMQCELQRVTLLKNYIMNKNSFSK